MGKHRMFTTDITESDAFLDMPKTSQCLYFHLCMNADDDGFISNPKTIMKLTGSAEDDMKVLIAKNFIIPFETKGIVAVKHWRMHNLIRKDRKKPTPYQEELAMLSVKDNGSYTFDNQLTTKRQPNDNQLTTKCPHKLSKDKLSKDKLIVYAEPTLQEVEDYCRERGNKIDAKLFFDYYTVNDWKDSNGKQVKNWKLKLLTWENHQMTKAPAFSNNTRQEPTKSLEEAERELFGG